MKVFIIFILFSVACLSWAQDERFFRRILSGDLIESERVQVAEKTYHFVAKTPLYEIDLNADKKNEAIAYEVKDGEHWVYIYNSPRADKILFKGKMETAGREASLFKIAVRELSANVKVLLLFFYEGNSHYLELNGTGRVYLLTFENNDFKTLSMAQGPSFFQEREERNYAYYQRKYEVELYDYNRDALKEVVIKHGYISRVMMYLGKGQWKRF